MGCKAELWLSMNGRDYLDPSDYAKPVTITLFDDQALHCTPACALVEKTAKTVLEYRGIPKSPDLTVKLIVGDKTFELKSKISNSTSIEAKLPSAKELSAAMLFELKPKPKVDLKAEEEARLAAEEEARLEAEAAAAAEAEAEAAAAAAEAEAKLTEGRHLYNEPSAVLF